MSLVFQRPRYVTRRINVMVNTNSFVVVQTVTLLTAQQQQTLSHYNNTSHYSNCSHDDADVMTPVVMTTHLLSSLTQSCHSLDTVKLETQVRVNL